MPNHDLLPAEKRSLLYLETLPRLLSYRSLEHVLADALAVLVSKLGALGGSVCYVSALSANVRQGELEGPVLEQIDRWEPGLRARLPHQARTVQLGDGQLWPGLESWPAQHARACRADRRRAADGIRPSTGTGGHIGPTARHATPS